MSVRGVLQNYLEENVNKRVYQKHLWEDLFRDDSRFMTRLKNREVYGVLEHPSDSRTKTREISHVLTEVRFATPDEIRNSNGTLIEGDIIGSYDVIDTAAGRDLAGLHRAKVGVGVSSRGDGTTRRDGNRYLVEEFELDTWDVVAAPSVRRARPKPITESQAEASSEPAPPSEPTSPPESTPSPLHEANPSLFYRRKRKKRDEFHEDDKEVINEMVSYCQSFKSLQEGIDSYCEDFEKPFPEQILEAVKASSPSPEPKPTRPMSNAATLRTLKGKVLRLCETDLKGLKFHQKSALLEEVSDLRGLLGPLHEDTMCRLEVESLNRRLQEFEEEFEDETVEAPPGEAPPAPAEPTPTPAPEATGEDCDVPLPAPVVDALTSAADTIEELTSPEDQEAQGLVQELRDYAECDGDSALEGDDADFIDDIPPALTESRRKAIRTLKESRAIRLTQRATEFSAKKLLESHTRLKRRANRLNESEQPLGGYRATEWKEAAEELAESYNKDMTKMTLQLLEATEPDLYKANKDKLVGIKNLKRLNESIETLRKASTPAPSRTRLAESEEQRSRVSKPLTEAEGGVHPSVMMRRSMAKPPIRQ